MELKLWVWPIDIYSSNLVNFGILERGSWRVMEDDSREEKSGSEVGSCVKGSRTRKTVPPLMEELLPD